MLIKQKSLTFKKPGPQDFWRIAKSVLSKDKSAIPPLFSNLEKLSSASDKAKLFTKNFSKNSNLDDSGISLPVFPSRTNLKLRNISVFPKMVKKVITNLDSLKTCGPDCISVVVLIVSLNFHTFLLNSSIMSMKESCFPRFWTWDPVFKNVGERSTAKNYRPVRTLSVASKVFEKLVNNRIVDPLKKCYFFF